MSHDYEPSYIKQSTSASSGTILRSNGTTWASTTATYPNTTTAQAALYSSAANTIGEITATNNSVLGWNNSGTFGSQTTPRVTAITFDGTNNLGNYVGQTSFTPTITGSTGNPTPTYTVQSGNYIRIGNAIFFCIDLQVSALTGGTGALRISSLPFTASSSDSSAVWQCAGYLYNNTNFLRCTYLLANNTSYLTVIDSDSGGSSAVQLPQTTFKQFWISGFYFV